MYSILIVDDDTSVINDILSILDKHDLKISKLLTANNVAQAKQIFSNNESINILLTDIEMPNGNGLELVEWAGKTHPDTVTILLTCHADFMYAKKAVKLGCIDYLVKPVSFAELAQSINNAQAIISEINTNRHHQLWVKNNDLNVERFWYDLINRVIILAPEYLEKMSQKYAIHIDGTMNFLPIIISIDKINNELMPRDESMLEYDLKNLIKELIIGETNDGYIIQLNTSDILVVLLNNQNENDALNVFHEKCQEYIDECNKSFSCDISCYIGTIASVYDIADIVRRLILLENDNETSNRVVFSSIEKVEVEGTLPDINLWKIMIKNSEESKVLLEMMVFLKELGLKKDVDLSLLYSFRQDLMQIIYYYLTNKGIPAHKILGNETLKELAEKSVCSVADMQIWVQYLISNKIFQDDIFEGSNDLINNIKQYIESHLDEEDMTRETISDHVFLNTDYLSKLFKKETGVSITKYIIQERMKKAKNLLLKTDMPVSLIATSVGYYHFSHFSKMFKKYFGLNPTDYRKHNSD